MAAELFRELPRAADSNNHILSGATWSFYAKDTLTPQPVYADPELSTSLGAAVTADAGGAFVPFYLDSSLDYRAILETAAGGTIKDVPQVNGFQTRNELADPATGADLIGYDDDTSYSGNNIGYRFNILSATMRPAMNGIFSSGSDQRSALLAFIAEAAAGGKAIEWGPIDLSLDAVTLDGDVRGLGIPSGSRWVMHPNTRFRALPNGSDNNVILNIRDAQDVIIEGGGGEADR